MLALLSRIREASEEASASKERISELEDAAQKQMSLSIQQSREITELKARLASVLDAHSDAESRLKDREAEIVDLKSQADKSRGALQKAQEELSRNQALVEDGKTRLKEMEASLREAEKRGVEKFKTSREYHKAMDEAAEIGIAQFVEAPKCKDMLYDIYAKDVEILLGLFVRELELHAPGVDLHKFICLQSFLATRKTGHVSPPSGEAIAPGVDLEGANHGETDVRADQEEEKGEAEVFVEEGKQSDEAMPIEEEKQSDEAMPIEEEKQGEDEGHADVAGHSSA